MADSRKWPKTTVNQAADPGPTSSLLVTKKTFFGGRQKPTFGRQTVFLPKTKIYLLSFQNKSKPKSCQVTAQSSGRGSFFFATRSQLFRFQVAGRACYLQPLASGQGERPGSKLPLYTTASWSAHVDGSTNTYICVYIYTCAHSSAFIYLYIYIYNFTSTYLHAVIHIRFPALTAVLQGNRRGLQLLTPSSSALKHAVGRSLSRPAIRQRPWPKCSC